MSNPNDPEAEDPRLYEDLGGFDEIKEKLVKMLEEYGFENNWKDIKWGQWVDMEIFSQSDKIYDSIHILMALLYRPIQSKKNDKYTLVPFKSAEVMERAELFLTKVPARYWFGCANFFFQISNQYITSTKHSLELTIKTNKMLSKMTKHLPKWLRPKQLPVSILN